MVSEDASEEGEGEEGDDDEEGTVGGSPARIGGMAAIQIRQERRALGPGCSLPTRDGDAYAYACT